MALGNVFEGGVQVGSPDRIDRILALIKRWEEIDRAIDRLRYQELVTEVPELLKCLGAAKDAVIAELKTV